MNCKIYNTLVLSVIALLALTACGQQQGNNAAQVNPMPPDKNALIEVNKQLTEKDKDIIEAFIRRKQWNMTFYPDGYYGMIIEEGTGPLATDGVLIEMSCTIKMLDGTVCYENQLHEFVVGKSAEISGLQRAALQLRQGAKARFIFPPHLAYGLAGDRDKIGARSILLFEINVVKLNPN